MDIGDGVALVTGGASGLGLATAGHLVAAGAAVVIADLPTSAGREQAERLGPRAAFAPTDVTDEKEVAAALDLAESLGPVRYVVNCAGVVNSIRTVGRQGPFPLAEFERVVRVNLVGTYNVVRLAAERIARTEPVGGERGVVVNTASVAAFDGQIGQAAYAASKGGVASLTLPLARDLSGLLIRVVAVAPGLFATPMLDALPEAAVKSLGAQTPHPARLGEPAEYAALVAHIIANPMLNGEVIRLDGSIRMTPR
ncbi:SDR family NAD(P)-dependent oxidoreductase [Streptomyces rubrogriseus]|uniref:SDR family NAD(P)-dependent oxidoreductase n=1 Tax=Streptomyces rubrogriseus TaxID=194673 RepID=UPI000D58FBF7|nr:SDR family NAD(P)-dependent oxidoreductase [Streptomyces rubrogriseus]MYS70417.1 SDR family NAD(P)-dependent oxidoreductase [Streptomyces sp. SID5926]